MDEVTVPVGLHETSVFENPQVLRHGARRDAQQAGQGAHAKRPLHEKSVDLDALLHGERPKDSHHIPAISRNHFI